MKNKIILITLVMSLLMSLCCIADGIVLNRTKLRSISQFDSKERRTNMSHNPVQIEKLLDLVKENIAKYNQ